MVATIDIDVIYDQRDFFFLMYFDSLKWYFSRNNFCKNYLLLLFINHKTELLGGFIELYECSTISYIPLKGDGPKLSQLLAK